MATLDKATLAKLAEPFDPNDVAWKPRAVKGSRALAVAYIDARTVAERLDQVVAGDWAFDWEQASNGCVKGELTVCGMIRCDVGEQGDGPQGKTLKAAVSDSLKRSAVLFGVGRYLYRLPAQWVDYDAQYKRLARVPELPAWAKPGTQKEGRPSPPTTKREEPGEAKKEQPKRQRAVPKSQQRKPVEPKPQKSTRPYPPETVKAGVLSRASKSSPVLAEQGFRGLIVGYIESVWKTEMPDVREANRHLVFTYLFRSPTSKKMTTGQGKGVLEWLTDEQPDGKPKLNAYAVIEANMIVKLQALEEKAGTAAAMADAEMRDQLERDIELGETGPGPEGMG